MFLFSEIFDVYKASFARTPPPFWSCSPSNFDPGHATMVVYTTKMRNNPWSHILVSITWHIVLYCEILTQWARSMLIWHQNFDVAKGNRRWLFNFFPTLWQIFNVFQLQINVKLEKNFEIALKYWRCWFNIDFQCF